MAHCNTDPEGSFVAWKRERGLDVEVLPLSATGGTPPGVRRAIADRYAEPEGLTYVILVGDVQQVPTNVGSFHGADSDGLYALLAGDDLYVDVCVCPSRPARRARSS